MAKEYTEKQKAAIAAHPELGEEVAAAFADELMDPDLAPFWDAMVGEQPASWPRGVPWPPR